MTLSYQGFERMCSLESLLTRVNTTKKGKKIEPKVRHTDGQSTRLIPRARNLLNLPLKHSHFCAALKAHFVSHSLPSVWACHRLSPVVLHFRLTISWSRAWRWSWVVLSVVLVIHLFLVVAFVARHSGAWMKSSVFDGKFMCGDNLFS